MSRFTKCHWWNRKKRRKKKEINAPEVILLLTYWSTLTGLTVRPATGPKILAKSYTSAKPVSITYVVLATASWQIPLGRHPLVEWPPLSNSYGRTWPNGRVRRRSSY